MKMIGLNARANNVEKNGIEGLDRVLRSNKLTPGEITPEDLGKILNDEEYFEQNPSKTIEEMLSKRRTKQNDGKNGLYDCLDDKNIRESSIKETTNMVKEEILKNDREKTNEEQK